MPGSGTKSNMTSSDPLDSVNPMTQSSKHKIRIVMLLPLESCVDDTLLAVTPGMALVVWMETDARLVIVGRLAKLDDAVDGGIAVEAPGPES
jgi:hypothetical protein